MPEADIQTDTEVGVIQMLLLVTLIQCTAMKVVLVAGGSAASAPCCISEA